MNHLSLARPDNNPNEISFALRETAGYGQTRLLRFCRRRRSLTSELKRENDFLIRHEQIERHWNIKFTRTRLLECELRECDNRWEPLKITRIRFGVKYTYSYKEMLENREHYCKHLSMKILYIFIHLFIHLFTLNFHWQMLNLLCLKLGDISALRWNNSAKFDRYIANIPHRRSRIEGRYLLIKISRYAELMIAN